MKTIWKFQLEPTDHQFVEMPKGAEILTVQIQGLYPCIWAIVETEAPKLLRNIVIVGTGNPLPEIDLMIHTRKYIGTFQQDVYVWHVFEIL